ncbi:MAG: isocitrate lyase/phosphoenolpyruvate mutase family protein [Kiloniellales bacterium]|nr:isocitrate lyase/phosphoenolpyruvate mutase family protein [Kiloniellales bacterium]
MTITQAAKAETFRRLHETPEAFILPNAWDAGSAKLLAAAGFPALASTSAGIAYALGRPDASSALSREENLAAIAAIAAAVDLPVSADLEAGYGRAPEAAAETIRLSAEAGAVGGSIEDVAYEPEPRLLDAGLAAERIAAAAEAAAGTGFAYTLTARCEAFLLGHPDPLAESVRRLNLFREAGAHCLYAPGVKDLDSIAVLAREVTGPLNVVMGLAGAPLSLARLAAVGVRRVSVGGCLMRTAQGALRRAAEEMRDRGTFGFAAGAIADDELIEFFSRA